MKFIIYGGGDSDVGIPSSCASVTFESNDTWDKSLIETTKDLLREWDDNGARIETEEEYNSMIKQEQEHHKEMMITDLENSYDTMKREDFFKMLKEIMG